MATSSSIKVDFRHFPYLLSVGYDDRCEVVGSHAEAIRCVRQLLLVKGIKGLH